MEIQRLSPKMWARLSEDAHRAVFSKIRSAARERIDYVWLAVEGDNPVGYVTVREHDSDTVYWQYGGGFQWAQKSMLMGRSYDLMLAEQDKLTPFITTRIENSNVPMLRLAMSRGFLAVGVRSVHGIFLELVRDRKNPGARSSIGKIENKETEENVASNPSGTRTRGPEDHWRRSGK